MAFASVLNGYCDLVGCSNKELAARCGISMSSLSRYRNGKRAPRPGADVIDQLAAGISSLAKERGIESASSESKVRDALRDALLDTQPLGPSFADRVNSLMSVLGIKNSDIAAVLRLDSSYISRIRRGERIPNNQLQFAESLSRLAAVACMENDMLDSALFLMGYESVKPEWEKLDIDTIGQVAEAIRRWILGNQIVESDVEAFDYLFYQLDEGYCAKVLAEFADDGEVSACLAVQEPTAKFYQDDDFAWSAEQRFLQSAAACGAKNLYLSSDLPGLETELTAERLEEYQKLVLKLIRRGCHITVVQSTDRPLREYLATMLMWLPLYMTGSVTPLYLEDASSRLFCHANNVCECCAMSSEAVRGHENSGRYYLTSLPEDIAYYRRKMDFILEKTCVLLEVYSCDNEEDMRAFARDEAIREATIKSRELRKGKYEHLRIVLYEKDCAVLHYDVEAGFKFVIRQPKLRYVLSHMS